MMLLAMDTATRIASLALHDGYQICYESTWQADRQHTTQLTPRLLAALGELDLRPDDLSGVAVVLGPGSFTGLRVGMAAAKGFALALGIPIAGIPTLDVVAAGQGRDRRPLMAVLQAGRGRICVAAYRWREGWECRKGPWLTTWERLAAGIEKPTLFCGEVDDGGRETLKQLKALAVVLSPAQRLRRAGFLAELGWDRIRRGQADAPDSLVPFYLHQPV